MSASVHALKASFNGGEMTQLLDARVDTEKHATGCRVMENLIPRPYGGVMKRPGTRWRGDCKDMTKATRLIEFRRSSDVNFVIEISEGFMRFWQSSTGNARVGNLALDEFDLWALTNWATATAYVVGDKVVHGSVTYICTTAHTSGSSTEPGVGADWPDNWTVSYFEIGDLVRVYPDAWVTSTAYTAGDIVWTGDLNFWTCILDHTSSGTDEPGVGGSYETYWEYILAPASEGVIDYYVCYNRHSPASAAFSAGSNWHQQYDHNGSYFVQYEYPAPWLEDELFQLQYRTLNDVMFLAHPNHFPRRLTRLREEVFVLEEVPFEFAPALDVNETTTALQVQWDDSDIENWDNTETNYVKGDRVLSITQGTGSQPPVGTLFTCHTDHDATAETTEEPGNGSAWGDFWNVGTSSTVIPAWAAGPYVVGQKVRYLNVIYECVYAHTALAAYPPGYGPYWARQWKISSADGDLSGLALKMVATEDLFTSDDVGGIWQLSIGTTGHTIAQAMPSASSSATTVAPTSPLFIQGPFLVRTNWLTNQAPTGGSLILEESFDGVTWSRLKEWALDDTADANVSSSFEAPATGAWYRVSATYNNNTAADKVFIEPESSVLVLPFKIEGYTDARTVTGKFIMPNNQLPPAKVVGVSTTVYRKPAFTASQGYPRTVTFHDGRLWWGGTEQQPARIWGSALDDFYIYLPGANDDDAIDVTLASSEANAIQWISSQNRQMVIGTTAEEWTLDSGETDEVLTPSKIRARRRTRYGSEPLAPVLISDALLWVQRGGKKVREFAYRFETDSYTAPEMTLLAEHLFRSSRIVQMAFAATPDPIIWAVDDAGVLHGFSYDRDQQITAWHRHRTGEREELGSTLYDSFESVATIYGQDGKADEVWFVVKRTIGGDERRYIESFEMFTSDSATLDELQSGSAWPGTSPRRGPCYVDCAQNTNSSGTGLASTVLATLGTERTLTQVTTVTGGAVNVGSGTLNVGGTAIDLTPAGSGNSQRWAGLPIYSRLRPMKLEIPLRNGTSQARRWRLTRLWLNLLGSCGGKVSPSYTLDGTDIDYQGQSQPYTGQLEYPQEACGEWQNQLDLYITHSDPTPFNILAAILQVEVST